jgi:hypothetical protein
MLPMRGEVLPDFALFRQNAQITAGQRTPRVSTSYAGR